VPNRVRPAAAEGLGALAATLSDRARERAVEALTDALRDPCPRLQQAAAQALGRARAHAARPALEALAHRLARQDAVRVLRVLRELAESPAERATLESIERLEERVRKLSAQLDSLQARFEARGSAAEAALPARKG
jgi:HEAT repeat protein